MIKSITQSNAFKVIMNFMNDSDRGPGHGIMQGAFYGLILCSIAPFVPWWVIAILCVLNHVRVLYGELEIEDWKSKTKTPDFYFDAIFRPAQTDIISFLAYVPQPYWSILFLAAFLAGWKLKSEWPAILWWKK